MNTVNLVLRNEDEVLPMDLKHGEGIIFSYEDGTFGLMCGCPSCGHAATGTHKFNPETNTLTPSLQCRCGYHGHLTNGVFDNVPNLTNEKY